MADKTEIFNLALRFLGDTSVTAGEISGNSNKRARVLNEIYASVRRATIAAYPWSEARKIQRVHPEPTGELLLDLDVDDPSVWFTTGGGGAWSFADGKAICTAGPGDVGQNAQKTILAGLPYTMQALCSSDSFGTTTLDFRVGGIGKAFSSQVIGTVPRMIAVTTLVNIAFEQQVEWRASDGFAGTVDRVSCKLETGGFDSLYQKPTGTVRVWRVGEEDEPETRFDVAGDWIRADADGVQRIVTLNDLTDENTMSPMLVTALASHLAAWAGPSLGKSESKTQRIWNRYNEIVADGRPRNRIPGVAEEIADLDVMESIRA
jgi:hypothetical protein